MKEKKNIDRLFQEKFKDFEAQPAPHVWESIAAREKQKRKRVIPLWIKLGGVAAVLALLLLGGNFFEINNPNDDQQPKLVQEEKPQNNTEVNTDSEETNNAVVEASEQDDTSAKTNSSLSTSGQSQIAEENAPEQNKSAKRNSQTSKKNSEALAFSQSETIKTKPTDSNTPQGVTAKTEDSRPDTPQTNLEKEGIAANTDEEAAQEEKAAAVQDPDELLRLANQEEAVADTDEESENSKSARWGIAPIVAPVYYGDFGGSGIDPQFADNAKRGDINLSYGVQVSYALNDKFKLRAGINRVDLGYRTEQVAFSPSIQANALRSVDYNKSASQVQVSTFNNREDVSNSIPNAPVSEEFAASNFASPSSTLRQQLGYIEVPLEAEYALIDKKIGMQIIGGFSTLFLNDDSVILEEGSRFSTELGSSNSLNNTSFSTNIGLGFDYRITPTLEFNLEPMFKYQLNAYTNGVSDFKPYYMGIYTGINLKF